MMKIFSFDKPDDKIYQSNGRLPTSFSLYSIDKYIHSEKKNIICLPRCVDYILTKLPIIEASIHSMDISDHRLLSITFNY